MVCYNNDQLSFTLKNGIKQLGSNSPPSNKSLLRHYPGGIIASWYKKVILTIDKLPLDWYRWHGNQIDADYLLIDENLLNDISTIFKVLKIKSLVIYSKQAQGWYCHPKIKKLGTKMIWLNPGTKKCFSWPKLPY